MKLKRFFLSTLLNRRQREIIWSALEYSAHTYERRKQSKEASQVTRVIDETSSMFGIAKENWTKEELDQLIDRTTEMISSKTNALVSKAYNEGMRAGRSEAIRERIIEDAVEAKRLSEALDASKPIAGFAIPLKDFIGDGMKEEFSKEKCENCEAKEACDVYNNVLKEQFEEDDREQAEQNKTSETAAEASGNGEKMKEDKE